MEQSEGMGSMGEGASQNPESDNRMEAFKPKGIGMDDSMTTPSSNQPRESDTQSGGATREDASEYGGRIGNQARATSGTGFDRAADALARASDWVEQKASTAGQAAPVAK